MTESNKSMSKTKAEPSQKEDICRSQLIEMVYEEAARRSMTIRQTAAQLGVTSGYLFALRNGQKREEKMSRELTEAIARFLGVSVLYAMKLSGQVKAADHLIPDDHNRQERELRRLIRFIREDVTWAGFVPENISDPEMMLALIRAYETSTGLTILKDESAPGHSGT